MLRNFRFVGVGGTKLETVIEHILGQNLLAHKHNLGIQSASVCDSHISPDFVVCAIGSNSTSWPHRQDLQKASFVDSQP